MKNSSLKYHLFGLFLFPALLAIIFTLLYGMIVYYYDYLPPFFGTVSLAFYELAGVVFSAGMFFALGAFFFDMTCGKIKTALFSALIALYHAVASPVLAYLACALVIADVTSTADLAQYFILYISAALTNAVKLLIGACVCVAMTLFFKVTKREMAFARPYAAPVHIPSLSALTLCGSLALLAFINLFTEISYGTFSGDDIVNLCIQLAVLAVTYFWLILASYTEKKFVLK